MRRVSFTTVEDVKVYFKGGGWQGPGWHKDEFEGSHGSVDVKVRPLGVQYSAEITAVDDPSDSETVVSEKPLKAIADFVGRDLPGGEHFERMSSSPAAFAAVLRAAAVSIASGSVGRRKALAMLRRLACFSRTSEAGVGKGGDMESLAREAERKGWDAELKEAGGEKVLEVNISDVFLAKVTLDSILYSYDFSVRGHSDLDERGTTDDPIREFRRWRKSEDVAEAVRSNREEVKSRRELQDLEATNPVKRGAPAARLPVEEPLS